MMSTLGHAVEHMDTTFWHVFKWQEAILNQCILWCVCVQLTQANTNIMQTKWRWNN